MEYKGYNIKSHSNYPMYEISRIGKGALPESLRGMFSSTREASLAIDSSESKKNVGGTDNAKSVKTSGDK